MGKCDLSDLDGGKSVMKIIMLAMTERRQNTELTVYRHA